MKVWFAIPSKRPAAEAQACIDKWSARGYKTAIWRDAGDEPVNCDLLLSGQYEGYAKTVNKLAHAVLSGYPEAQWIVTGGDDTDPEPNVAPDEIASQLSERFQGTFGVMQPTGDRWADGSIDRIAGSPWMGREFCERIYRGSGPFWPEFRHMYGDEHLLNVAEKLGVYWRRRDLTHMHNHFVRVGYNGLNHGNPTPPHLVQWNTPQHWNESQAIFNRLRAGGFAEAFELSPQNV